MRRANQQFNNEWVQRQREEAALRRITDEDLDAVYDDLPRNAQGRHDSHHRDQDDSYIESLIDAMSR